MDISEEACRKFRMRANGNTVPYALASGECRKKCKNSGCRNKASALCFKCEKRFCGSCCAGSTKSVRVSLCKWCTDWPSTLEDIPMASYSAPSIESPPERSLCESIQQSIVSISKTTNREPTPEEEQLSKLLIEKILPPFNKSIKLQAIVVYQADQEKMNCLLVNRRIDKRDVLNQNEVKAYGLDQKSRLSDSGFVETPGRANLTPSPSKSQDSTCLTEQSESIEHGSRRKRKLCRPCKIPQNGVIEPVPFRSSSPNAKLFKEDSPVQSQSPPEQQPLVSVAPTSVEVLPITQNGLSDSVLLPVSAVTLLPRVSLFSLPVTVLSTLPRPILPRVGIDRPACVTTVFSMPTTLSQPVPSIHTRPPEPSHMSEQTKSPACFTDNNSLNRRFGKSFICNQCRKDFASLNLLCAHTFSVHRGFRCTICRAQFTQRSNLQRHSLRHVGFKPFVCKICDKAYYRKDHLVRHIELTHPGCDPRVSLTVKLSSAECLDFLEKLQQKNLESEQAELLYQTSECEVMTEGQNLSTNNSDVTNKAAEVGGNELAPEVVALKSTVGLPLPQPVENSVTGT
ncbi:zinc finger protein sens [Clonorchis sinensis]|uniref:Zinc finger protein sens n=2 Tax=Clonorchis sinensis TaxID=79923 RepID=G7YH54_CLOSI|nr:zinc finger protein sens [Clonorchis sinensis]